MQDISDDKTVVKAFHRRTTLIWLAGFVNITLLSFALDLFSMATLGQAMVVPLLASLEVAENQMAAPFMLHEHFDKVRGHKRSDHHHLGSPVHDAVRPWRTVRRGNYRAGQRGRVRERYPHDLPADERRVWYIFQRSRVHHIRGLHHCNFHRLSCRYEDGKVQTVTTFCSTGTSLASLVGSKTCF